MLEERPIKPDLSGRKRECYRGDWIEAQLTYEKKKVVELFLTYLAPYRAVFVLQWTPEKGYAHNRIEYASGGSDIITCPDAQYLGASELDLLDRTELRNRIFVGAQRLDKKVREFLLKTIDAYPHELRRCEYCKERRPADCGCCDKRACIPCVKQDTFLAGPCERLPFHGWRNVPNG